MITRQKAHTTTPVGTFRWCFMPPPDSETGARLRKSPRNCSTTQERTIRATTRRGKPSASPEPSEWVFPSKKAEAGHLTTVAKQFRRARRLAGLPESLKLYGARHAFPTYAVEATGNVFAVADAMGQRT